MVLYERNVRLADVNDEISSVRLLDELERAIRRADRGAMESAPRRRSVAVVPIRGYREVHD
jgi:hypothetical protein